MSCNLTIIDELVALDVEIGCGLPVFAITGELVDVVGVDTLSIPALLISDVETEALRFSELRLSFVLIGVFGRKSSEIIEREGNDHKLSLLPRNIC